MKTIDSLEKRDPELCAEIKTLKPGENKVVTIHREKNTIKTLLSATAFQTEGLIYKLIAFQNVNEALDENESQAWRKLLSVMTHEIMNSVAPISSLADTLMNRLKVEGGRLQTEGDDIEVGIRTIKEEAMVY